MSDFNRIHQVIHGTIKDEGNPAKGCTLFACIGALILNKHYKIPARAVAGGFAICVEPEKNMFFGRDGGGTVEFDEDGFHMWVQTETHIIDFMSPLYEEAFQDVKQNVGVPRRMFQKRLADEAPSLGRVDKRDSQVGRFLIQSCFLESSFVSRRPDGRGMVGGRRFAAA
jgi:hypothetical protein